MKLDFLVRWLPPKIDGVGDYTWNLASRLHKLGVDVRVFTSTDNKGIVQNEWIFPIIHQWQPRAIVRALKTVSGHKPDWFCFQYVPQMYGRWGIAWEVADILQELKKEFSSKVAVVFHEFISSWGLNPKDLFLATVTRLQTRRMLSVIDLAITTCNRYKDALLRLAPKPLAVVNIPVGANIEPVDITPEELRSIRNKIFPEQAKIFGLFSRLSPGRNFPLAVWTLERARKLGLDAHLHLIGNIEPYNPVLFNDLMKLAQELRVKPYITTTGELSREDISIHLKMVDVFIFPQCDGISTRNTTLMSALGHGLPVVSFQPQPGNFDGFNIPCGVLVDRNDEEGFIWAAIECLKNSYNLSVAAQENIDYFYRHFSWQIIAKQYLEALKD